MSIAAVAKKAGVSAATVSRVLSGLPIVQEETAEQVRRAIAELGYKRSRSMRRTPASPVSMEIPKDHEFVVMSLGPEKRWLGRADVGAVLAGIRSASEQHSIRLHVVDTPDISTISQRRIQGGIVFIQPGFSEPELRALAARIPLVRAMGADPYSVRIDHVCSDSSRVGQIGFDYLAAQRCASFACITDEPHVQATRLHAEAFSNAAMDAGHDAAIHVISHRQHLIAAFPGVPRHAASLAVAVERICSGRTTIGLFVPAASLAARVYAELEKLQMQPGKDALVIACRDDVSSQPKLRPPPAWIDLQWKMVGRMAVQQLIHRISNPSAPAVRVQIPPVLGQ